MFSDVAAFFFQWSFMGVLFFALVFFFALFEPHTAKNPSFLFIFGLLAMGGVIFFLVVGMEQRPPRLAPRGKRYLSDLRFAYDLFRDPQRSEEDLTQEMKLFLFALFGPALALGQASLFAEKIVSFQRGSDPYDGCSSLATIGGGCGSDGCGGGERGGGGCGGGDSGGGGCGGGDSGGGGCGGGGCGGGGCGGGGD